MEGHGYEPRAKTGPALAGHGAEAVRDAIAASIGTLPHQLRRSLTWDQGAGMAQHAQLRIDTGLAIYFCDPQSPWQRGTNENTNGLLRQYFPKGTDLTKHSANDLAAVVAALNGRPRKTLSWKTRPKPSMSSYAPLNKTALRRPVEPGQYTSWTFSQRVRAAGLAHSLGTIGDAFDNAAVESLWARRQTELLDTRKWMTRVELSTAIFDWVEVFYNRTRRHSSLGMLSPAAYERLHRDHTSAA
jgi:Integrase core domain